MTTLAQTLWVPGPLPGLNEMLADRGGRAGNAYAKMKKKWTSDIALLARVSKLRPMDRVKLRFVWHEKHRQRNPDNIAAAKKFVIDGLVMAKVLRNDGWDQIAAFTDDWMVAKPPGVLVLVEPVFIVRNADNSAFVNDGANQLTVPHAIKRNSSDRQEGAPADGEDEENGPHPRGGGGKAGVC